MTDIQVVSLRNPEFLAEQGFVKNTRFDGMALDANQDRPKLHDILSQVHFGSYAIEDMDVQLTESLPYDVLAGDMHPLLSSFPRPDLGYAALSMVIQSFVAPFAGDMVQSTQIDALAAFVQRGLEGQFDHLTDDDLQTVRHLLGMDVPLDAALRLLEKDPQLGEVLAQWQLPEDKASHELFAKLVRSGLSSEQILALLPFLNAGVPLNVAKEAQAAGVPVGQLQTLLASGVPLSALGRGLTLLQGGVVPGEVLQRMLDDTPELLKMVVQEGKAEVSRQDDHPDGGVSSSRTAVLGKSPVMSESQIQVAVASAMSQLSQSFNSGYSENALADVFVLLKLVAQLAMVTKEMARKDRFNYMMMVVKEIHIQADKALQRAQEEFKKALTMSVVSFVGAGLSMATAMASITKNMAAETKEMVKNRAFEQSRNAKNRAGLDALQGDDQILHNRIPTAAATPRQEALLKKDLVYDRKANIFRPESPDFFDARKVAQDRVAKNNPQVKLDLAFERELKQGKLHTKYNTFDLNKGDFPTYDPAVPQDFMNHPRVAEIVKRDGQLGGGLRGKLDSLQNYHESKAKVDDFITFHDKDIADMNVSFSKDMGMPALGLGEEAMNQPATAAEVSQLFDIHFVGKALKEARSAKISAGMLSATSQTMIQSTNAMAQMFTLQFLMSVAQRDKEYKESEAAEKMEQHLQQSAEQMIQNLSEQLEKAITALSTVFTENRDAIRAIIGNIR